MNRYLISDRDNPQCWKRKMTTIVWFRQDLRIRDNPALFEAAELGEILPIYIWSAEEEGQWAFGEASRWWLARSLEFLQQDLQKKGVSLFLCEGPSLKTLLKIIDEFGIKRVFWNRRYEPLGLALDKKIELSLTAKGVEVTSFNASLLVEPWKISTKEKKPFQVFTPFWKTLQKYEVEAPFDIPRKMKGPQPTTSSSILRTLRIPKTAFHEFWQPGEQAAFKKMQEFVHQGLEHYIPNRDRPDLEGVSRISPHLHFGEIGPRQIWKLVEGNKGDEDYLREIAWREFAYHLIYHFPTTPERPLRDKFSAFPWSHHNEQLEVWKIGKTGYPIVDAGMRQLLVTGWMHNRVRMIVGSFLTKDLMLPWQEGAHWFWQTLVDADLANNTLGWQWVSGCGADAAPYFRVFNPVTQGNKFDPEGNYVRTWIPELKNLATRWIHAPWEAPKEELQRAGVSLGMTYPLPIVDHDFARKRALAAFETIKAK